VRAADLAGDGGAGDAVVAVGVVAGDRAELVFCQLGCLCVVRGGLVNGGGGAQRAEFQQRFRRGGAVQVPVGDDGAVVGVLGAAVVRVQVLDELCPGGPEWDGPGAGVAEGVAGVVEDVAETDPGRGQHGREGADRIVPS
jgi:hypothetical protein